MASYDMLFQAGKAWASGTAYLKQAFWNMLGYKHPYRYKEIGLGECLWLTAMRDQGLQVAVPNIAFKNFVPK